MGERYRCSCDAKFNNLASAIKHCRKEHADNAYSCYDQFGSVGDKFADSVIESALKRRQDNQKEWADVTAKASAYEGLVKNYNILARAFELMRISMEITVDALGQKP